MAKPQPILSHMPRHIKEKIVNSLHTVHKLSIRQCSKEFKSVVDQSPITYESLTLNWNRQENALKVKCSIGNELTQEQQVRLFKMGCKDIYNENTTEVEFHPRPNGFLKKTRGHSEVFVENGDFIEAAVEQFVKILRNPKVFINCLYIYLEDGNGQDELYDQRRELIMDKLNASLGALGHRVAVGDLTIHTDADANNILRVLPHLQPGTLEDLCFSSQSVRSPRVLHVVNLNGITGMEQWKQATTLAAHDLKLTVDREATAHFEIMRYRMENFGVEDLKQMLPCFLRKDGWVSRSIRCENCDVAAIRQYLSELPGVKAGWFTFTVRRDGFECRVSVYEFPTRVRICYYS